MRAFFLDRMDSVTVLALLLVGVIPLGGVQRGVACLKDSGMNLADTADMERGYYEAILDSTRRVDYLMEPATALTPPKARAGRAAERIPFERDPRVVVVDDLRGYALRPGFQWNDARGSWTNNSRGMRDLEYEMTKRQGVIRIALLGDSIGAGWGVDDRQTYEAVVESRWNEGAGQGLQALEIWNYSVPGYAPGQRWEGFLRLGGFGNDIDVLIYQATPAEPAWDERRLRVILDAGQGWDAPQYAGVLGRIPEPERTNTSRLHAHLRAKRWEILGGVYGHIASACRARGVLSVWILVPRVGREIDAGERRRLLKLARDAGFAVVIDLSGTFDGIDASRLAVAPDDYHPNAEGHERLADAIETALRANPEITRLTEFARRDRSVGSEVTHEAQKTGGPR